MRDGQGIESEGSRSGIGCPSVELEVGVRVLKPAVLEVGAG